MDTVFEFFRKLFWTESWPPRWYCGEWTDFHGWLYIFSNLAIWAAYFAIPLVMLYFVFKRKDEIPFIRIFWLFILFILACGSTHLADAMLFYYPAYRLSGLILFICALVSWAAVIGLARVMPEAIQLKSPVQLEKIINKRTRKLKELSDDLAHQNEQLTSFTDITSHNLRSPAANLVSLTNLYEDEDDPEKKEEYFQLFKEESRNMLTTLEDLYEVVKVKKNLEIKREQLDFEQVFKKVLGNISTQIENSDAKIEYDFTDCPKINYPPAYLESIFLNFLTNSIKYRSPEGKPEIFLKTREQKNGDIVLTCKDNGRGIDLDRFGEKLFKLHQTFHGNQDGRGVGLYLTKTQVESLGGSIFAESEPGKGAKFIVYFNSKPKRV